MPVKQRIYVFVGYGQKNCEYYDVSADSCSEICPVNDKMKALASACLVSDKFIYLVGGDKDWQNNFLEKYELDGEDKWEVVQV